MSAKKRRIRRSKGVRIDLYAVLVPTEYGYHMAGCEPDLKPYDDLYQMSIREKGDVINVTICHPEATPEDDLYAAGYEFALSYLARIINS